MARASAVARQPRLYGQRRWSRNWRVAWVIEIVARRSGGHYTHAGEFLVVDVRRSIGGCPYHRGRSRL